MNKATEQSRQWLCTVYTLKEICQCIVKTGSATERKAGSGRLKSARSDTNIAHVEELDHYFITTQNWLWINCPDFLTKDQLPSKFTRPKFHRLSWLESGGKCWKPITIVIETRKPMTIVEL